LPWRDGVSRCTGGIPRAVEMKLPERVGKQREEAGARGRSRA